MADYVDEWPTCEYCGDPMPLEKRSDARFCCGAHQRAAHRDQERLNAIELWCEDAWRWLPRVVKDESVDLVISDFPYRNEYVEETRSYETHSAERWTALCENLHRVLKPGRRAFLWANNHDTLAPMGAAMRAAGFQWLRPEEPYQWVKTTRRGTIPQGQKGGRSHEYIASFAKPDEKGRVRDLIAGIDNLLPAPRPRLDFRTAKPVGVLERLIKATTYAREVILDPFGGSGSTALAARSLGRRALLCENDEATAFAIARRLGVNIVNYVSYDEWLAERRAAAPDDPPGTGDARRDRV